MATPLYRADSGLMLNMYDCTACPKCQSTFRAPFKRGEGLIVECDDCGFKEPWTAENGRPPDDAR